MTELTDQSPTTAPIDRERLELDDFMCEVKGLEKEWRFDGGVIRTMATPNCGSFCPIIAVARERNGRGKPAWDPDFTPTTMSLHDENAVEIGTRYLGLTNIDSHVIMCAADLNLSSLRRRVEQSGKGGVPSTDDNNLTPPAAIKAVNIRERLEKYLNFALGATPAPVGA